MYEVRDISAYGTRLYRNGKLLLSVHAAPNNISIKAAATPSEAKEIAEYLAAHFNKIEENHVKRISKN